MERSTRNRLLPAGWTYKTLNDRGLRKNHEEVNVIPKVSLKRFAEDVSFLRFWTRNNLYSKFYYC